MVNRIEDYKKTLRIIFPDKTTPIVLVGFIILIAVAITKHEPWLDEAQAWLLASDLSVYDLLVNYIRYEGSPPLWHLILMIPAKLGLPYSAVNVVSAIFATGSSYLFLRFSPFPKLVKILFPFTYFIFFQYGVIARSYCLLPFFLFLIAAIYRKKIERPFIFAALLCLLAGVSMHGFLIAGSIMVVHIFDVIKKRGELNEATKRAQLKALAIFSVAAGLIVLMLVPPSDLTFARGTNWGIRNFFETSWKMISSSLTFDQYSKISGLQSLMAALVFVTTLWWLWLRKFLSVYLLPLVLLCILFAVKWNNLWHQGILFCVWIFALWLSFEGGDSSPEEFSVRESERRIIFSQRWAKLAVSACLILVMIVQIHWTIVITDHDRRHNYSAGYDVAQYIKTNNLERGKIYVAGYHSAAVLPYFKENIFSNYGAGTNHRFWFWSTTNTTAAFENQKDLNEIYRQQPDLVILSFDPFQRLEPVPIEGYAYVGTFEGTIYWKTGAYENESYILYRKL